MLTEKELEEIRRKLLELEEEPPGDGWQNIRARLKPRRRWRLVWWLLPVGLLLTTVGGLLIRGTGEERPPVARTTANGAGRRAENGRAARTPAAVVPDRNLPIAPDRAGSTTRPGAASPAGEEIAGNRRPGEAGRDPAAPPARREDRSRALPDSKPGPPVEGKARSENQRSYRRGSRQSPPPGEAPVYRIEKRQPGDGLAVVSGEAEVRAAKPANGEPSPETRVPAASAAGLATFTPLRSRPVTPGAWLVTPWQVSFIRPASRPADSSGRAPEDDKIRVQEPAGAREWTVGVFAAPRYSFRLFAPQGSDEVYIMRLNNRNTSNTQRMGYELGLALSRSVSARLALRTSLAYTQLNENLSYTFATGHVDTVLHSLTREGEILVNPVLQTGERQLISSYAYAGWRAGATWYVAQRGHRRYHVSVEGGVNLLVKGRTKTLLNGQAQETVYFPSRDNLLEQTNYNLQVGLGYSFRVRRKYEGTVMPALNYFLGSTFRSREPFGLRPYSLGVHLQLSRRVGRTE